MKPVSKFPVEENDIRDVRNFFTHKNESVKIIKNKLATFSTWRHQFIFNYLTYNEIFSSLNADSIWDILKALIVGGYLLVQWVAFADALR